MTIKEVSERYDLTADTLRYYEKIGLISNVPRTKNGIRNYDDKTCRQIEYIKCMRKAGVEIESLIEYIKLLNEGKHTAVKRKKLLEMQKEKLVEKQKNISETIERLNYKLHIYDEIISGNRKDFLEE